MRRATGLVFLLSLFAPTHALAWDYLEHSWFTDVACARAQAMLAAELADRPDDRLRARYLALGLYCPVDDPVNYCRDGYKMTRGAVNLVDDPAQTGDFSVTLGDIAALPDHVSRFGPVQRIHNAQDDGLVLRTLEWLTRRGSAGGVIEDVAEDACETELADFAGAMKDIEASYSQIEAHEGYEAVPHGLLLPGMRDQPPKGPEDPTARYSFNNPHYLDLVLRNHTHFGEQAFSAWVGFHSAALRISQMRCEELVPTDPEVMEDLADGTPLEDIDWQALGPAYGRTACDLFGQNLRERLAFWLQAAPTSTTAPVREFVSKLTPVQADQVVVELLSLVFEGSGVHFLQDGLASGHMRTVRSRESLSEVRHDHDVDNQRGVVANMDTRSGEHVYWAYGDTYLLSKTPGLPCNADWKALGQMEHPLPEVLTACSIRHQRGVLAASTAASLLDWAVGGPAFDEASMCGGLDSIEGWICHTLPTRATVVSGANAPVHGTDALKYGTLPVPPPAYSYESLSVRVGLDIPDNRTQLGVTLSFLEQLDHTGHWMTSYRFGLHTTLGGGPDNQWVIDASYQFHYRLSARFMFEAGPFLFGGLRDVDSPSFFSGVGPSVGIAALPEGWINMPLEVSLTYRLPLVMFTSDNGFFADDMIDGHWLQAGLGLAYSH